MKKTWSSKETWSTLGFILVILVFLNYVKRGITEQDWTDLIRLGVIVFIMVLYNIYKEHKKKKKNN